MKQGQELLSHVTELKKKSRENMLLDNTKEARETECRESSENLAKSPNLQTCNHRAAIKKKKKKKQRAHDEISVHSFFPSLPVWVAPSLFLPQAETDSHGM